MAQFICRYQKGEQVRWISHLDLKRTLERALRRAGLPLELTKGYNPRPRLSFGPPLPLGATGDGELFAVHLSEPVEADELKQRLNRQLPSGLEALEMWRVPAHQKRETFGQVDVAEYRIMVSNGLDEEELSSRVSDLMRSETLPVQRGGRRPEREVDLRPLIMGLEVSRTKVHEIELRARLKTGSHGGARPQELASLLHLDEGDRLVRYHRTGLYASAEPSKQRRGGLGRRWRRARSRRERSTES